MGYYNGISHQVAKHESAGVYEILESLSYVPKKHNDPLPILRMSDPVDREIMFYPSHAPYDPRWLIEGRQGPVEWESGFFDHGSFREIMASWAQTVVTGRARLGGIPIGVIAV